MPLKRLGLRMFKQEGIDINWDDLVFGYERNLINDKDVLEFIELWLEKSEANGDEDSLKLAALIGDSILSADGKKIIFKKGTKQSAIARKKWIWLILSSILNGNASERDKLEEIAEVWSELDYPEEMKELIYYQPASEPDSLKIGSSKELLGRSILYKDLLKSEILKGENGLNIVDPKN